MRLFRRLGAGLAALALNVAPVAAAADDSALNAEGYWTVGRGSADSRNCMASLPTKSGGMFILRAEAGEVWFAVGAKTPIRTGDSAELSTEAYSFDFEPSFGRGGVLMADGPLNERALAALRLARGLMVRVDGREVFSADVEGTGLEWALDAVVACAQGQSGWWGPGVLAEVKAEPDRKSAPPLNAEGYWTILPADGGPGVCSAVVPVDDKSAFLLIANREGRMTFAVGSDDPMRRGAKGSFQTDAYSFGFRPTYDDDTLMFGEDLDSQAIFAIRRARTAKISVNRRTLIDIRLESTGHAAVIDDVMACARSERGWWGEGAAKP